MKKEKLLLHCKFIGGFSPSRLIHHARIPHWTVFPKDFFSGGMEVDLEVLQHGCTPPWRRKLQ
jgi:hypothetical protein